MSCQLCKSERLGTVSAKCDDRCSVTIGESDNHSDYVPQGVGIGGGDYIEFSWCLDCGQIQGKFPLPVSAMELTSDATEEDITIVLDFTKDRPTLYIYQRQAEAECCELSLLQGKGDLGYPEIELYGPRKSVIKLLKLWNYDLEVQELESEDELE